MLDARNVPYGTVKRINIQLKEEIVSNEAEQMCEEYTEAVEAEQPTQDGKKAINSIQKKRCILITTP